jgi:hypothetical protein
VKEEMTMSEERRRVAVALNEGVFLAMLQSLFDCFRGNSRVIGVFHEWKRNSFFIVLEDEGFESVPEGLELPEVGALNWDSPTRRSVLKRLIQEDPAQAIEVLVEINQAGTLVADDYLKKD